MPNIEFHSRIEEKLSFERLDRLKLLFLKHGLDICHQTSENAPYKVSFSSDDIDALRDILDAYEDVLVSYKLDRPK